jgi:hypothetical protein
MVRIRFVAVVAAMAVATGVAAATSGSGVDPWLLVYPQGGVGDAQHECGLVGDYAYSYKIDPPADGTYAASFTDGHSNTIAMSNLANDGRYFDWSATHSVGAVIVKGGTSANVFAYDPQSYSDTALYSPDNASGDPAAVSHATFCWNLDAQPCLQHESAWGSGPRYAARGNWATYTPYPGLGNFVLLKAGQSLTAGTITFGSDKIRIQLYPGWFFGVVDAVGNTLAYNIHIQSYSSSPSGNPKPGQFENKYLRAGQDSGDLYIVPGKPYYGIHTVLLHSVECP